MRFIHLANVNLPEAGEKGALGEDLYRERYEDFLRVLATCKKNAVDLLLIAGNLFSHQPSKAELDQLDTALRQLPVTRVFIVTGKNDAWNGETLSTYVFKSGALLFNGGTVERVFLKKLDLEITAAGYHESTWKNLDPITLTRGLNGSLQLLLLPFLGEDGHEIPESFIKTVFPFDYVALGTEAFEKNNRYVRMYSPGTFEPIGFTRQIRHGYFLTEILTVAKRRISVDCRFVKAARREHILLKVHVTPELTYETVEREVAAAMEANGKENHYKIILSGQCSPGLFLMKNGLYHLGNVVEIADETDDRKAMDMMKKSGAEDAVSKFLSGTVPADDEELIKKALVYGVNALVK